ncbi:MAG TPA: ribosome biogenesis GTP-binding protein YihA/YsxC [Burkholderiaceae bacterium]|nr:ribosome biogenesis GTP-binding protein YihA/YsxC [Burkholderiaceae bacterium]
MLVASFFPFFLPKALAGARHPSGYAANFTEDHGLSLAKRPAAIVIRRPSFSSAEFAVSVAQLPALSGAALARVPELAFVGRSNAGKSTAINLLTGYRRLAFASKTPGRTQMLNFFSLLDDASAAQRKVCAYLVDLPGYGFAKADKATRKRWDALVGGYLRSRRTLRGVVLVMDARRPCLPADQDLVAWICSRGDLGRFRLHLLLSKSDQLGTVERRTALAHAEHWAHELPLATSVQLFSAHDRSGLEEFREAAMQILEV